MPKRNETLKFSTSFLGTVRASATTTIVDTSYPMTYNTRWSTNANGSGTITEVNEGNDAYFIVSSDNVPDGTVLSVMLSSGPAANGITGDDIVNYQYKQNITIYNNFASLKVSIAADQVTENREEFYGMLLDSNGSNLSYAWLAINDTSKTPPPTYIVGWYPNMTSTNLLTSINEGSTAWVIITGTNIPNGTSLTITLSGGGIDGDDFTDGTLSKTVIMQNNVGRVSYVLKNDFKTEGTEIITATVSTGSTIVGTANISILDTSVAIIPPIGVTIIPSTSNMSHVDGLFPSGARTLAELVLLSSIDNNVRWSGNSVSRDAVGTGGVVCGWATTAYTEMGYHSSKIAAYTWNPSKLSTLESRKSFGKYQKSFMVKVPWGNRLDSNWYFAYKAELEDSIANSQYGPLPNLNSNEVVMICIGEGYNYNDNAWDHGWGGLHGKIAVPQSNSMLSALPIVGSRNGYLTVLCLRAFNDANINGIDTPYPKIIKAGIVGEAKVNNVYRNLVSQDFRIENKFSIILSRTDLAAGPTIIRRYEDRFELAAENTSHTNWYCGYHYIVIQNYE